MIDLNDEDIVYQRYTTGKRFALFCSTDLPPDDQLPWWSVVLDIGGDGAASLVRLDESAGSEGWTLLALLTTAVERARAEEAVRRSVLLGEAIRHLDAAVAVERTRRGDLPEFDRVTLRPAGMGAGWPWLVAEFGDETLEFAANLTGDDIDGVPLELVVLVIDQLIADAAKVLPGQGSFGAMAVHVSMALQAIAQRDQHLRALAAAKEPSTPTASE